jgi:anti-sigma factor (TIGR02949 family)
MSDRQPINCEEALQRLFEYIDHELDGHKHEEMDDHLSRCLSCYSRLEFEQKLRQHLKQATGEKAPPVLHEKIANLIRKL